MVRPFGLTSVSELLILCSLLFAAVFAPALILSPQAHILPTAQSPLSDYTVFDYTSFNTRTETIKRLSINYPIFGVKIDYDVTFNATTPADVEPLPKAIIKLRNATDGDICGLDIALFKTNTIDVNYVYGTDLNSTKKGGCSYYAGMVIHVFYDGANWTVRDYSNTSNVFAIFPCANFTLRAIEASGENDSTTNGYAEVTTDIATSQTVQISANAARFLLNCTFNSTLELCSEEPMGNQYSNRFWICSDNLLAYYALQNYDQTVSDTIKKTIMDYAIEYSLPVDDNGLPISCKHEPIVGDVLPDGMPRNPNYYSLKKEDSYEVATEVNNGSLWTFWPSFADILAWKGMSSLNQGNYDLALRYYKAMMSMWDGFGFADAHYFDINCTYYEPFKLALAIILRQRLGLPKPAQEYVMEDILLVCQRPNGGIATGYDRHLDTTGHVENTETTALVVIANVTIPAVTTSSARVKVGLFYYVWYQGVNGTGHWNGTPPDDPNSLKWKVVDKPILGFYNSSDPAVIKQHLEWFKELGIDFLIISWWGPNSFEDNTTKAIFSMIREYDYPIQVVIMVEAYNNSGTYDFKAICDYINNTYVAPYGSTYMKLNRLPLVCFFNDNIKMTKDEPNRVAIHSVPGFSNRIVGQSDYVDWYAWRPCNTTQDSEGYPNIFPKLSMDGFTCIEPRYDDTNIGGTKSFDENYTDGLYDEQWRTVQEYRDQGNLSIVAIYSWNEYHERSEIEPHISPEGKYVLLPFYKTYHYIQTVPEFPSLLILPLFMIATLLVVMVHRRKGHRWRLETE